MMKLGNVLVSLTIYNVLLECTSLGECVIFHPVHCRIYLNGGYNGGWLIMEVNTHIMEVGLNFVENNLKLK